MVWICGNMSWIYSILYSTCDYKIYKMEDNIIVAWLQVLLAFTVSIVSRFLLSSGVKGCFKVSNYSKKKFMKYFVKYILYSFGTKQKCSEKIN